MGNQAVDEDELDDQLAELQQEELDNRMVNTGNVPVGDTVHKMPTVATGEGAWLCALPAAACMGMASMLTVRPVKGKAPRHVTEEEDDEDAELRRLQAEMAY